MEFPKRTLHPCKFARGCGADVFKCEHEEGQACPFQRFCQREKRWVPTSCKENCKYFQPKN